MGLTGAFTSLVTGGLGLANSSNQASALKRQGQYEQGIYDTNAATADAQAADALARGDQTALKYFTGIKSTVGQQRAGFAANGVDPNSGSASDVLGNTEKIGQSDIVTIKANAFREAMGYTQEASSWRRRGRLAKDANQNMYNNTILTGGLQFIEGLGSAGKTLSSAY